MEAEVLNWEGKKVSEVTVREALFKEKPDKSLLQSAVVWQLARRRAGSHKTKTRAEVRGGGRKPFRQKGTGNARQGSIRSPLLEGGGVAHGPRQRSYDWALPKKVRQKALRQALSYLFQEKRLFFVENMKSPEGKTKELSLRLKKMGLKKALLVDEKAEDKFKRACSNLRDFKFLVSEGLNVYDILKFNTLLLTPDLLETVYKKCGLN